MYARIQMSTDKQSFSDAALVVENIVENLDVKRAFWAEISPPWSARELCSPPTPAA